MAGSRRKGGKKAKVKNLSLGDLVLAKIKGFPAWPAKVSRPEDWKQEPDPKKYFVQFFGTQEIAFVPPADIQAFTSETKNKLSAKCQIKTKYFVQAVKEICVEYDELHEEKSRGLRDETDISKPGCEASSVDGVSVEVEGVKANLKDGTPAVAPGEEASSEGTIVLASDTGCNSRRGEKNSEEKKACVLSHADDSSCPVMSSEGKQKMCSGEQPKKEVLSPSSSHVKEELSDDKIATVNCAKRTSREDQKSKNMAPMTKKRIEEGQKSSSSGVKLLRDDNSGVCLDRPESEERLKDKGKGKVSGSSTRKFSQDTIKADSNYTGGRKAKELPKTKSSFKATDDVLDTVTNPKAETTGKKKRCEPGLGKPKLGTDEILHPAKKSKVVDVKNDASKGSIGKNMKSNSSVSNNVRDKEVKKSKLKKSTSHVIASRAPTLPSSDVSGDEAVLPLSRRRQQALEGVSDSPALNSDDEIGVNPVELKSETPNSNVKISATRLPKRRRAVCLFIEDEEDEPETPVHDGFARNVEIPSVGSDASQSIDVNHATAVSAQCSVENSTRHENSGLEEASSQLANDFVSPRQPQTAERRPSTDASITPERSEAEESSFKEAKPVLISPRKSPRLVSATKQVEQNRTTKATIKISNNGTQKKALSGSVKVSDDVSDATKSSQNQFLSQRFDVIREDRSGVLTDSKTPDSAMSMKRLIAAAQAKRRQAHTQQYSLGNPSSVFLSRTDVQGASPSPAIQPFPSAIDNVMQVDVQGFAHQTNLVSPSTLGCQSGSHDQQDAEETEERRVSSGRRATGSSLSGGTEAAVARDAFEGMIETLSRTKESIGRATRLAIDCAKYGIANEVVELLIRKLESEASFHRKVDLFFLVDSITQCSHNQKGIAGASYIPTVQTALPRLLGAAAPPGASARENRRQCLKVLRLWLERKILPESFLRRYMDNIGVSNDDTISGFSQRRPSRAERAIDDPIREMEGMVVDEYGSNTTFQLPGFLSSNAFEDEEEEEDVPLSSPCRVADDASPLERVPALGELETCTVTPSDRPHRILEEVDGELEMEDVSGHPKNDRPSFTNDGPEMDGQQKGNMELASNSSNEYPPLPEGSPPLPPDSPPPPPPLPPSPSPPPPPSSPCPLPPPPPLPTQLPPLVPPSCPPPSFKPQPPVPPQPSLPSQPMLPPQSSIKSSPQLAYQPPAPHEFRGTPNGNQIVQMAGNAPHGGHIDAAVKRELFPISYEFRSVHNEMYLNAHSSQPSQQFQPGNPAFVQRPLPPNLPQTSSSHFSFTKPAMPPNPQHSYPQYSLPPQHDGRRPFVVDDQWRMPAAEYNTDNQHGGWIAGRNPPPCGPLFVREGYFRPPVERPSANNLGFPLTSANNLPAGAPNSGHGVFPCRPDMSAINCWRPA